MTFSPSGVSFQASAMALLAASGTAKPTIESSVGSPPPSVPSEEVSPSSPPQAAPTVRVSAVAKASAARVRVLMVLVILRKVGLVSGH